MAVSLVSLLLLLRALVLSAAQPLPDALLFHRVVLDAQCADGSPATAVKIARWPIASPLGVSGQTVTRIRIHLSPTRRRERKQQKFESQGSARRFLATPAPIYNAFNLQPYLIRHPTLRQFRAEAHRTWEAATVAA